jgi:hypothetical protein
MELNLQPSAHSCYVSGQPFAEGDRVASYLVRGASLEVIRYDLRESESANFQPDGTVACRWVHVCKLHAREENAERTMKLTADSLFLTLADSTTEQTPENVRLVQFLALMLERKRLLRPKGLTPDGLRRIYEHGKTKQIYEVVVGELDPAFFIAIQDQLSVLVGPPRLNPETAPETEPLAT